MKAGHGSHQMRAFKIFVGGLPSTVSEEELYDYFAQYGVISRCRTKKWRSDKTKCKGFAIIVAQDEATYEAILAQPHQMHGRTIECKRAISNKHDLIQHNQQVVASKVFVTGLPQTCTDSDLRGYFERFGPLEMAYVVRQSSNCKKSRIGFVSFVRTLDKDKAISVRNHKIGDHRIFVNEYHTKTSLLQKYQENSKKQPHERGEVGCSIKQQAKSEGGTNQSPNSKLDATRDASSTNLKMPFDIASSDLFVNRVQANKGGISESYQQQERALSLTPRAKTKVQQTFNRRVYRMLNSDDSDLQNTSDCIEYVFSSYQDPSEDNYVFRIEDPRSAAMRARVSDIRSFQT